MQVLKSTTTPHQFPLLDADQLTSDMTTNNAESTSLQHRILELLRQDAN